MTCAVHQSILPRGRGVSVIGVAIPRDLIARETQHHPSRTPTEAWKAAARALVVRELLLQEARRLEVSGEPMADGEGRRETEDEAAIRTLIAREVQTPTAAPAPCSRAAVCAACWMPPRTYFIDTSINIRWRSASPDPAYLHRRSQIKNPANARHSGSRRGRINSASGAAHAR